jgi:general secretion pathway protein L
MDYLIIQVDEKTVEAARFTLSGRTATLSGAVSFPLGESLDVSEAARQIASGITGSPRIVLCLSPRLFANRVVELPLTDLRKVREVLSAHLQGEIALPVEEAVFDVLPIRDGRFLAVWAKKSEILRAIEQFREAGCEPQIVTASVFGWPYLPIISEDCAVSDGTAVAVIAGGRLSYLRAIDGADPYKQLLATLAALELSGDGLPSRLLVFGSQAGQFSAEDGLPQMAEKLEFPDELAALFRTEVAFQQLVGLYAVARACHAGELPDFRRDNLVWTAGNEKARKKLILTAVLAVAAVVLLFAYKGLQYRAARADVMSLNSSISSLYREIFPNRTKAVDELAEVKGELRKLSGSGVSDGTLDVLKRLAEAKGTTIQGLYEVELEGTSLRVKGDARSSQAVNEFKAALTDVITAIELGEIKSRPDGTVSFSLTGTVKEISQ